MRRLVLDPPPGFSTINAAVVSDLGVTKARYLEGSAKVQAMTASVAVTEYLHLKSFGDWTVHTSLHLRERSGDWLIAWSSKTIDPSLVPGSHFAIASTWPARAQIFGANGAPLTKEADVVNIGVEGSYVKNPSTLGAALIAAGATASEVNSALGAAKANPSYFEPVFSVNMARYLQLKPTLYPLPGTVFSTSRQRQAITTGLQAHLVGSVAPITGQELAQLGAPYDQSSLVGQTGLEQIDESQLAGAPGYSIEIVGSNGVPITVLARTKAKAGKPLSTTIDPAVQRAAEMALAPETKHAALVAIRASTGAVLAAVSDPASDAFDQSLDGAFPPGSTFKTITASALIAKGLSPASPASCPPSLSVGGELFHNAEGDTAVQSLAQAFAESCNTAFIALAEQHLDVSSLPQAARQYDITKTPQFGLPAFGGAVPRPINAADLAATAIGQSRVLVSPLDMAMVAAAIDSGTVREPRLVLGAPDDQAPSHLLDKSVVDDLRQMMAAVVAHGTAANVGLPAGTDAKTGTAEYGSGNPLPTDAWLIGFRGDIAFAVLIVDGGLGGPTAGPIAARFLQSLANQT